MKTWIQRIRGAAGMGLTWAVGWAPVGAIVGALVHWVWGPSPIGLAAVVALNSATFAVLGFIGGMSFATVLRIAEGRRRFDELSLPRFAAWGAAGGLLLGAAGLATGFWGWYFGPQGAGMLLVALGLGSSSAAGSLALARGAEDAELLGEGDEVANVGLSAMERRQLLADNN
jgi:hypothetical protein